MCVCVCVCESKLAYQWYIIFTSTCVSEMFYLSTKFYFFFLDLSVWGHLHLLHHTDCGGYGMGGAMVAVILQLDDV